MEMAAYVGDVLSFYLDNQIQENYLQYARQPNNLYDMAYMYGYDKPKELGIIRLERVKCGKPNCRCADGKKHKAYYLYYRVYDEYWNRKLKKKYIPKSEVKKWRRKIQLRKNEENLPKLYDKDDELFVLVWEELEHLPRSKMIERFHTVLSKVKERPISNVFLLDV